LPLILGIAVTTPLVAHTMDEETEQILGQCTSKPFLRKLWLILHNPEHKHAIRWDRGGEGICIIDEEALESDVLPHYFKSNKIASFRRQLNYFHFDKQSPEHYTHNLFHEGHPEALLAIQRRENKGNTYKMARRAAKRKGTQPKAPKVSRTAAKTQKRQRAIKKETQLLERRCSPRRVRSSPPRFANFTATDDACGPFAPSPGNTPREEQELFAKPTISVAPKVPLLSIKQEKHDILPPFGSTPVVLNESEFKEGFDELFGEFLLQLDHEKSNDQFADTMDTLASLSRPLSPTHCGY